MRPVLSAPDHPWTEHFEGRIYGVRYPRTVADSELQAYFAAVEAWWARVDGPIGWLLDGRHVADAPARQRRLISEFDARLAPLYRRCGFAKALVLPSSWHRGIATAIHWVSPPRYDWTIVADVASAMCWLREHPVLARDATRLLT